MKIARWSFVLGFIMICLLVTTVALLSLAGWLEGGIQATQSEPSPFLTQQPPNPTMPPMDFYPLSPDSNIPGSMLEIEASELNNQFTIFSQVGELEIHYHTTNFPDGVRLTLEVEIQNQEITKYGYCSYNRQDFNFNYMSAQKGNFLVTELVFPGQVGGVWSYVWVVPVAFMCNEENKWYFYVPDENSP